MRQKSKKRSRPVIKLTRTSIANSAIRRSSSNVPLHLFLQPTETQPTSSEAPQDLEEPVETPSEDERENEQSLPAGGSKYYTAKARIVSGWDELFDSMVAATLEQGEESRSYECVICAEITTNPIVCMDCGPTYLECYKCASSSHDHRPFHLRQKINVIDGTQQTWIQGKTPWLYTHHTKSCPRAYNRSISAYDATGSHFDVVVRFCHCQHAALTLTEMDLWPASPANPPSVAFHSNLMKLADALMMEGHVSLKSFCNAIQKINGQTDAETKSLYRLLCNEAMDVYTKFALSKESVHRWTSDCPICPQMSDPVIAMDGNFGLTRKRHGGFSLSTDSYHFFMDQDEVRKSVETSEDALENEASGDCSNFEAGKVLKPSRSKRFDITGIFGCVCRHEIPVKFLDMHHGERLGYPIALLKNLMASEAYTGKTINVTYDIACLLQKHLQKLGPDGVGMLDTVKLAVPIFHGYGHEPSCQVKMSPYRQPHFGLFDGEAIERLWAYLRPFALMTREMTGEHRRNVLNRALVNFSQKKIAKLDKLLVQRMDNATKQVEVCTDGLKEVAAKYSVSTAYCEEKYDEWSQIEEVSLISRQTKLKLSREDHYALKLSELNDLTSASDSEVILDHPNGAAFIRLEATVTQAESQLRVERWSKEELQVRLHDIRARTKAHYIRRLRPHAVEIKFLKDLLKKYPDGQSKTARIRKQLKQSMGKLKKVLAEYSKLGYVEELEEAEAFDASSPLFSIQNTSTGTTRAPPFIHEVTRLISKLRGAREEAAICRTEMKVYLESLITKHRNLVTILRQKESRVRSLVSGTVQELEHKFITSATLFQGKYPEISIPDMEFTQSNSVPEDSPNSANQSSDSEYDSDEDI